MDESEHGGDKRFLPQFKDERLAARFAFAMAAVVFDELYCMVGALGFVGIIAAAVDDILRKFAVYRGNLFADNNLSVFNGSVVFKYRVVGQWIANQSASRPATKLSN